MSLISRDFTSSARIHSSRCAKSFVSSLEQWCFQIIDLSSMMPSWPLNRLSPASFVHIILHLLLNVSNYLPEYVVLYFMERSLQLFCFLIQKARHPVQNCWFPANHYLSHSSQLQVIHLSRWWCIQHSNLYSLYFIYFHTKPSHWFNISRCSKFCYHRGGRSLLRDRLISCISPLVFLGFCVFLFLFKNYVDIFYRWSTTSRKSLQ